LIPIKTELHDASDDVTKETDMSNALTAAQRAELGVALKQRLSALEATLNDEQGTLSRAEAAAQWLDDEGRDDAPQRASDREVHQQRNDQEWQEFGKVKQALERLDTPGFGLCIQCGHPIGWTRLHTEPWAVRCVRCESSHDSAAAGHPAKL
jgi:DnaK suppressor protein